MCIRDSVWVDGEGSTGVGLPSELLVIIVFRNNSDLLGNEIGGVETDTELTDHANIGTSSDGLHETSGSRLGNGTKIVDELSFRHTNAGVMDGQSVVGLVWNDLDLEIWLGLKLLRIGDGAVSDLVESVRGVGNELSQEDLLVGIEGVDDQTHQLLDVSVERKDFFRHLVVLWRVFG